MRGLCERSFAYDFARELVAADTWPYFLPFVDVTSGEYAFGRGANRRTA